VATKKPQSLGPFRVREQSDVMLLARDINRQFDLLTTHLDTRAGFRGTIPTHDQLDMRGNPVVNVAEGDHPASAATVSQIQQLHSLIEQAQTLIAQLQHQVAASLDVSDATPSQIDAGDTASAGTTPSASRADHQHAVNTAAIGVITSVGVKAAGTSQTLPHGDHAHDLAVVATASLPAAGAGMNGAAIIEDTGATNNLILYAAGRRARVVGVVF